MRVQRRGRHGARARAHVIPGGRYAPAFAVGVAVAKYADHCPLERQVRMMAREGLGRLADTVGSDSTHSPGISSRPTRRSASAHWPRR